MAEKTGSGTVRIVSAGLVATLVLVVISNIEIDPKKISASIRDSIREGSASLKKDLTRDAEMSLRPSTTKQHPRCSELEAQGAKIGKITVWGDPEGAKRTAFAPAYPSGRTCIVDGTEGSAR